MHPNIFNLVFDNLETNPIIILQLRVTYFYNSKQRGIV